jgi:hypothetical protein
MRHFTLAAAPAIGIAILVNAAPAYADLPTIDVTVQGAVNAVKGVLSDINGYIQDIKTFLGPSGPIETTLLQGFTQNANYQKAAVGASEQIADASNIANARFKRDMRNAQLRDEHTPSPSACTALDNGVSTQAASVQAFTVAATIAKIHDQRTEAGPNMPSYYGQAQAVASINQQHLSLYCDANDVAARLCAGVSTIPDADQQFSSLFGSGTYADQNAVNTAKDYAINLIEPVAPAALRGDQLNAAAGQDAAVRRRSFNARLSLTQSVVDQEIGMQTPSVPLTALQQQYLNNIGLPSQTTGSWLQVLQIESERRLSDVTWAATLQSMTPPAVEREIAIELALGNYLQFQIFKLGLQQTTIAATHLAHAVERDYQPTVQMPAPSIAAQSN